MFQGSLRAHQQLYLKVQLCPRREHTQVYLKGGGLLEELVRGEDEDGAGGQQVHLRHAWYYH